MAAGVPEVGSTAGCGSGSGPGGTFSLSGGSGLGVAALFLGLLSSAV